MIAKQVVLIDPIRSVANVININSNRLQGWRRTGIPTATHGNERTTPTASQSVWEEYEIPVNDLYTQTPISSDMLDDVPFVEGEVTSDAGLCFAYTEGYDFVFGNGSGRSEGFMHNVDVDATKFVASVAYNADVSNKIGADDVSKLFTTLKSPYRANAKFAFNSATLGVLLSLKTTTGQFLWMPTLAGAPPDTIYNKPFILCESMESQGADSAGTTGHPIACADWERFYRIVDRTGIQLLRDPYSAYPLINFNFRKRVGGQILLPEAGKVLKTF